eukprot:c1714_g1_i1.p1 GENE.c1714_g1_i1~~c1714_g1_i1.p1  ORF type:complete len:258 (+),score=86.74 c1714_g1_i1:480-1253(+)
MQQTLLATLFQNMILVFSNCLQHSRTFDLPTFIAEVSQPCATFHFNSALLSNFSNVPRLREWADSLKEIESFLGEIIRVSTIRKVLPEAPKPLSSRTPPQWLLERQLRHREGDQHRNKREIEDSRSDDAMAMDEQTDCVQTDEEYRSPKLRRFQQQQNDSSSPKPFLPPQPPVADTPVVDTPVADAPPVAPPVSSSAISPPAEAAPDTPNVPDTPIVPQPQSDPTTPPPSVQPPLVSPPSIAPPQMDEPEQSGCVVM